MKWLLSLGGGGILFSAVFGLALFPLSVNHGSSTSSCAVSGVVSAPQLDAEAAKNATIVIATVASRGMPSRAAVIAIATALPESGLHNVNHGDAVGPDSRGLFQQRASWGPESVRMDPAGATGLFLDALAKVGSWETRPLGSVAQEVQKSGNAAGSQYATREAEAIAIVGGFQPTGSTCSTTASGPGQPGNPMPSCKPAVTQGYGPSVLKGEPAAHSFPHFHGGKDLSCGEGTPVEDVFLPGIAHVTMSASGYGNHVDVEVTTPQGKFFARYAHLLTVRVPDGSPVKVGDVLGTEGSTGYSTGAHLHFGVYHDAVTSEENTIDPSAWLTV